MHIPDGFLEPAVWLPATPVAAAGIAYALTKTNRALEDRQIPLLGVTGAFVFAAQMVNFPAGPGVSGHLMGGVLAAMLIGPHAAALVMTVVLAIQAFVFQDGGVTALGANITNMAIVGTYGGSGIARLVARLAREGSVWPAGVGAWVGVVLASLAAGGELAFSGAMDPVAGIALLGGIHAIIGVGEAAITVGVLAFLMRTRPDILRPVVAGGEA